VNPCLAIYPCQIERYQVSTTSDSQNMHLPFLTFSLFLSLALSTSLYPNAVPVPSCFASGPACLRPRLDECRDAISKMRYTDPGYITSFGRDVEHSPRAIDLPYIWHSGPVKNCVVKLDVTSPDARDTLRLQTLTKPAEEILARCVTRGSMCGGKVLVGNLRVLELTVGYYTAVTLEGLIEAARFTQTGERRPAGLRWGDRGNTTSILEDIQ